MSRFALAAAFLFALAGCDAEVTADDLIAETPDEAATMHVDAHEGHEHGDHHADGEKGDCPHHADGADKAEGDCPHHADGDKADCPHHADGEKGDCGGDCEGDCDKHTEEAEEA